MSRINPEVLAAFLTAAPAADGSHIERDGDELKFRDPEPEAEAG